MENIDIFIIFLFIIIIMVIILLNKHNSTPCNENMSNNNDYVRTDPNPLTDGRNRMAYPSEDDIVASYENITCKKTKDVAIDLATHKGFPTTEQSLTSTNTNNNDNPSNFNYESNSYNDPSKPSCPNKSLNKSHETGTIPYKQNAVCTQMLSNIQGDMNGIDPADFYRKRVKPVAANLEDERYSGYNYYTFEGNGKPQEIGRISLNKTNDFPVGVNYAFYT